MKMDIIGDRSHSPTAMGMGAGDDRPRKRKMISRGERCGRSTSNREADDEDVGDVVNVKSAIELG